jgi:hypothetical protein
MAPWCAAISSTVKMVLVHGKIEKQILFIRVQDFGKEEHFLSNFFNVFSKEAQLEP